MVPESEGIRFQNEEFAEAAALDAIRCHVRNSAETTFHLSSLETIYLEKLESFEIHRTSHTTRFAEKLKSVGCGVVPVQK